MFEEAAVSPGRADDLVVPWRTRSSTQFNLAEISDAVEKALLQPVRARPDARGLDRYGFRRGELARLEPDLREDEIGGVEAALKLACRPADIARLVAERILEGREVPASRPTGRYVVKQGSFRDLEARVASGRTLATETGASLISIRTRLFRAGVAPLLQSVGHETGGFWLRRDAAEVLASHKAIKGRRGST